MGSTVAARRCPRCGGVEQDCYYYGSCAWVRCPLCGHDMRPAWGGCIFCKEPIPLDPGRAANPLARGRHAEGSPAAARPGPQHGMIVT